MAQEEQRRSNDTKPSTPSTRRGSKGGRWQTGLGCAGILFFAFIFLLPDLLRPRISANESFAIGDVRAVILAQREYAKANGGHFDTLNCLAQPSECLPSYSVELPAFLSEPLDGVRNGYVREFIPGPPAEGDAVSGSSIQSYVFTVYPVKSGTTGVRSFCGGASGAIYMNVTGARITAVDGGCDPRFPFLE